MSRHEQLYQLAEVYTNGAFTNVRNRPNERSSKFSYDSSDCDVPIEIQTDLIVDDDSTTKAKNGKEYSAILKNEGVVVTLYTLHGPKPIRLFVVSNEVIW